jgi:hypothetical protein
MWYIVEWIAAQGTPGSGGNFVLDTPYFVLDNKLLAYYKKIPRTTWYVIHTSASIYALNFVVGWVNFVVHLLSKSPFLCSDVVR